MENLVMVVMAPARPIFKRIRIASKKPSRSRRVPGVQFALAAAVAGLATTAQATNYNEGPVVGGPDAPYEVNDLSNSGVVNPEVPGSGPTYIGALTLGSNFITGASIPYGTPSPMGDEYQDNDYASFTIPTGDVLSHLYLSDGTTIVPGDLFFVGIAKGNSVNVTPPSSAGLLGYTLVASSMVGSDILPALGMSDPAGFSGPPFSGATTFSGALPSGTYSLWLLDGDSPVNYNLNLQVSATPEPSTWLLMIAGIGGIGLMLRRAKQTMGLRFKDIFTA